MAYHQKIALKKSMLPSIHGHEYWGRWSERVDVADVIDHIKNEWPDTCGNIIIILGDENKVIPYNWGDFNTRHVNSELFNHRVSCLRVFQRYDELQTMVFNVVLAK